MTIFLSMFIFALIGAISPGPVNIIATGAGANFGFRRALPHVLGATIAYTLIVFLVGVGLNRILEMYPQITDSLRYLGGAFLLYMAYKIATSKPTNDIEAAQARPPSLLEGALSQWLNPKAWLVSMSGVTLFVAANTPASLYLFVFCAISFVVCLFGVGTWAAIGHVIRKYLSNERQQISFNIVMGLLLSSTVVSIFISA
ncbi:LysE family translocator [Alkalimarinus coralli]|uniref:LysE family translocator n=1 Tax=Alkalimarinus coralli TaxID=2935863 RepID=UPI00202B32D1|nr:LysE family translocator [Alkalimarinus coralli]